MGDAALYTIDRGGGKNAAVLRKKGKQSVFWDESLKLRNNKGVGREGSETR